MAITLKIGSPVEGNDFYGRERELELALKRIQNNNLMLAAPRRVGKTSFAKMFLSQMRDCGWDGIFVDLEGLSDIPSFFKAIHQLLMEMPNVSRSQQVMNYMKSHMPNIDLSANIVGVEAKISLARQMSDGFDNLLSILKEIGKPTVIILDEMTVFLEKLLNTEGDSLVKEFLDKFRALRQMSCSNCRWLVASSVGVRHFASVHHVSETINDFMDFPLGAFNDEEAMGLVSVLSESEGLDINNTCAQYMLSKIGWNIPYFIQLMVSYITNEHITEQDIDAAYEDVLRTSAFESWSERLTKEYGETEVIARKILCQICLTPEGKTREDIEALLDLNDFPMEQFSTLLMTLENDGYLAKDGTRRYFRSPLLRDYWKRKFCE